MQSAQRIIRLTILTLLFSLNSFAQNSRIKILFIPLDDRPPCLQFTQKMGLIGNAEVVSPPKELLGKFTRAGDPDKIISWMLKQDLKSFSAAIVSLDMLAFGGLVASRVHQTSLTDALKRLSVLEVIKKAAPKLPIYGQGVIMRLAPTSDGKNEPYREKLARWADISPYNENKSEKEKLEAEIPAEALVNYKQARLRNLSINQEAIKLTQSKILDYLILSQDDAKPKGIHVADREKLIAEVSKQKLTEKILVQPGTDEISMLLLARALNRIHKSLSKVFVKYSSELAANTTMPFEDRPLRKTVSYNIVATGAQETSIEAEAELIFYVFASRFDKGRTESFASEIRNDIIAGKRIMIADIDPKGNIQGGDPGFAKALLNHGVITSVYSYASWNTAGNTVGTTLPQGVIFHLAEKKLMKNLDQRKKIHTAQNWFIMHRLLDDYAFHTLVRPKANEYFKQSNRSGFERSEQVAREVEIYARELMLPIFAAFSKIYTEELSDRGRKAYNCQPSNMRFILPWNRTFEGEIDFDMVCD